MHMMQRRTCSTTGMIAAVVILSVCYLVAADADRASVVTPTVTGMHPTEAQRNNLRYAASFVRRAGEATRKVVEAAKVFAVAQGWATPHPSTEDDAASTTTATQRATAAGATVHTILSTQSRKQSETVPRGATPSPKKASRRLTQPQSTNPLAAHASRRQGRILSTGDTTIATLQNETYTNPSQIIFVIPQQATTQFCYQGEVAVTYSSQTLFNCTDANGVNTTRSATYVRTAPPSERANCSYIEGTSPHGKQCLCSSDYLLFRTRPTFFGCLPRNLTCETRWVGLTCRLPAYAEPEPDMDSCVSLTRSSSGGGSIGNLQLAIDCAIQPFVNPSIYDPLGAAAVTPPNASYVWMPITTNATNSSGSQPTGTYDDLSINPLIFPSAYDVLVTNRSAGLDANSSKAAPNGVRVPLTLKHPLVTYGTLELQFFDFNQPSRTNGGARVIRPLLVDSTDVTTNYSVDAGTFTDATGNVAAGLGLIASGGLWNITFDISTLPDNYFTAGRLYLEAGLLSPFGFTSRYSVSALEIEITDTPYPGPDRSYASSLTTGEVALIAVCVAAALFLILVVLWKVWRAPNVEDVAIIEGRVTTNAAQVAKKKN